MRKLPRTRAGSIIIMAPSKSLTWFCSACGENAESLNLKRGKGNSESSEDLESSDEESSEESSQEESSDENNIYEKHNSRGPGQKNAF